MSKPERQKARGRPERPPVMRGGDAAGADWETSAPASGGVAATLAERLAEVVAAGRVPDLHGVVVVHGGHLVAEHYGSGPDYSWGWPCGEVRFAPGTLHDLRSVTKSVVALLYGIALVAGKVPEPAQPLLPHFPEYPDLAAEPARARLTVAHALTMTLGLDWNEDAPYTTTANSELAMEMAADRYRYVLGRPVREAPGERWRYCGGASALLGHLIARGVGAPLHEYAQEVLFAPLGIGGFEWMAGTDQAVSAASGLRLAPRDLARIGQTMLAGGVWQGRQVIPEDWLAEALRPRVRIADDLDYGYQWYLSGTGSRRSYSARGNGGQRLYVFPELELVVVTTAGRYDADRDGRVDQVILEEVVRPVLDP